jgi:hypothetical protein
LPLDPGGLKVILTDLEAARIMHMDDEGKLEEKRILAKRDVGPTAIAGLFVLFAFLAALLLPSVVLVKFPAETIKAKKPGFEPTVYPVSPKSLYDLKVVFADPFHMIT